MALDPKVGPISVPVALWLFPIFSNHTPTAVTDPDSGRDRSAASTVAASSTALEFILFTQR